MDFIKKVGAFFDKLNKDHINEYTAQCAYYTFLSFIPFIILLLSLIKYVNIGKDTLTYILEAMLPNVMKSSILDIIQEVYSKSFEAVSISALLMLWSASKSFYALNKGLLAIYKKEEKNYMFLLFKGILWAIFALLLIVAILLLLVFGNSIETAIKEHFGEFNGIANIISIARSAVAIAVMFFIFLLMYKFTAGKGKKFKYCVVGAVFTAIAWYAISFFFSIYVNIFTNFSVIYGSLATIIIIMMWLYAVIYTIMLGAEINVVAEEIMIKFDKNRLMPEVEERNYKN